MKHYFDENERRGHTYLKQADSSPFLRASKRNKSIKVSLTEKSKYSPAKMPADSHMESAVQLHKHSEQQHLSKDELSDHATNLVADLSKEFSSQFKKIAVEKAKQSFKMATEVVKENITQHKFAKLAEASYQNFNGKDVKAFLTDAKHEYIPGLADFEVDNELSSLDDLVLHNSKTGETVISYRGTQVLKDWGVNAKIAFEGGQDTKRFKNALNVAAESVEKYGSDLLKTTGHSQGAGISTYISQMLGLEGHHFQPALSLKQLSQFHKGEHLLDKAKQVIYRTHGDLVSMNSLSSKVKKLFDIKTVNTTADLGAEGAKIHSLDNFAPPPVEESAKGLEVSVERNTTKSALRGAAVAVAKVADVGMSVGLEGYDIYKDLQEGTAQEKATNIVVDTGKNVGEYMVADAILGSAAATASEGLVAALALAPETGGASLVAGVVTVGAMAATAAAMYGMDKLSDEIKESHIVEHAEDAAADAAEFVGEGFRTAEKGIEKAAEYVEDKVVDTAENVGSAFVEGAEAVGDTLVEGAQDFFTGNWW
mgnify:CR=1 FL=1